MNSKKFITLFLTIAVITGGLFIAPAQANKVHAQGIDAGDVGTILASGLGVVAACTLWAEIKEGWLKGILEKGSEFIGEAADQLLGDFGDAVEQFVDPSVPTEDDKNRKSVAFNGCIDTVFGFVIDKLKQRLLDHLTNETVDWIQGDGEPRYVTDPKDFFSDALDQAGGDTLRELGLGQELCSSGLYERLRIEIESERTRFGERTRCTLSQALGNVEGAIDAFHEDFNNGSWIAYQEIMKPQNNIWGLRVLADNELSKQRQERERQAQYEATVAGGFLDQKICRKWEKQPEVEGFDYAPVSGPDYYKVAPNEAGTEPSSIRYTGKTDSPSGTDWVCTQTETRTPGAIAGESIKQAIGADFDRIVNADDISTFAAAVTNAIVSRLANEAVSGLTGLFNDEDVDGDGESDSRPRDIESDRSPTDCSDLPENLRSYCNARTSSETPDVPSGGGGDDDGDDDEEYTGAPDIDMRGAHALTAGESHTHEVSFSAPATDDGSVWVTSISVTDSNGDTIEETSNNNDIAGSEGVTRSITFTPQNNGTFEITARLINQDSDGNEIGSTSDSITESATNSSIDIAAGGTHQVGEQHTHTATIENNDGFTQGVWAVNQSRVNGSEFDLTDGENEASFNHTMDQAGEHQVTVIIFDDQGNQLSETVTETIEPADYTGDLGVDMGTSHSLESGNSPDSHEHEIIMYIPQEHDDDWELTTNITYHQEDETGQVVISSDDSTVEGEDIITGKTDDGGTIVSMPVGAAFSTIYFYDSGDEITFESTLQAGGEEVVESITDVVE